jgi:hypothetical protein
MINCESVEHVMKRVGVFHTLISTRWKQVLDVSLGEICDFNSF